MTPQDNVFYDKYNMLHLNGLHSTPTFSFHLKHLHSLMMGPMSL